MKTNNMKTNNKKPIDSSLLIKKALVEARRLKASAEEMVKKEILESIAPSVKQALNSQLAEMDSFEDEEMNENDDEIIEDEDGFGDEFVEEAEGEEDVEFEDEEFSSEEESVEDVEDIELPEESEEEVVEESESPEGEDDDLKAFMEELKSLMGEAEEASSEDDDEEVEDEETLTEGESCDDEEEKLDESNKTGGIKFEALVKENRKLKRDLNKVFSIISETSMDMSRAKAYTSLVKSRKLTETQKLRIMKQLDTAKTERDIRRISESISAVTTSVNTPKKKTNIAENKK